jgi:hypothetical protein
VFVLRPPTTTRPVDVLRVLRDRLRTESAASAAPTAAEIIAGGAAFVMGPGGSEGTYFKPAASAEDAPLVTVPTVTYQHHIEIVVPLRNELDRLTAENAALQARAEAVERALRWLVDALEVEAKAKLSMDNAEENFSHAEPEIRAFDKAMIRAHEAMKAARAALAAERGWK